MKLKDTLIELKNAQEQRQKDIFDHEATKVELDALKAETENTSGELQSFRSNCKQAGVELGLNRRLRQEKPNFKLSKGQRSEAQKVATQHAASDTNVSVNESEDENNNDDETIIFEPNILTSNRFKSLEKLVDDTSAQTVTAAVKTRGNEKQSYTPTSTPPRKHVTIEAKVEKNIESEHFKAMLKEYSDAFDKNMDKFSVGIDSLSKKISDWSEKL